MTIKSKPYLSGEYADIFQASSTGDLTAKEAVAYSQSYFRELDNQSTIRFASEKGRAEGRVEEKIEIAKKMLSNGIDLEMISNLTGLSVEKILSI